MFKVVLLSAAIIASHATGVQADGLKVVTSFSILADIAANVGGDKVEITNLVGPNSDAHTYEPRPADVLSVTGAKVILMNGLGFEGFMERLVKVSATTANVIEVSDGIEVITVEEEHDHNAAETSKEAAHDHGEKDPHAFQSIPNVRNYVKIIAQAFCANDSANCVVYQANAGVYDSKLEALDLEIRADVAALPQAKRTIITSHDAFGYFAHEYGLKFISPEGISTDAEASAADVAKLIDQIREDKAAALFVESISDRRLIEQIAAETGMKVGGKLYSDALSGGDGPASTYIDLMRYNMATIKGAINGS
jgi:zinc/manganese transport system substrate-binding protein